MARLNTRAEDTTVTPTLAGGLGTAPRTPLEELRRAVLTCLLWEDSFYEKGSSIASRILQLVPAVEPQAVHDLAIEARTEMHLRHVPLFLVSAMAALDSHKSLVRTTLTQVIQRADELTEFLAVYWRNGKTPLSAQVKKGLADAFTAFTAYDFAKYNQANKIKLRDVLFLCHAKPKDPQQERVFKQLIDNTLPTPITWETQLSARGNTAEVWRELLEGKKLGGLAFIRNLRNMQEAGLSKTEITAYAEHARVDNVLPFRFVAAAMAVPGWEDVIEPMMLKTLSQQPKLRGHTVFVVDTSGSMFGTLSGKSQMTRLDAACALTAIIREVCSSVSIYATAGDDYRRIHATVQLPPRRGFALIESVKNSKRYIGGGGIFLKQVCDYVAEKEAANQVDRLIILTDEQDCDNKANPKQAKTFGARNYLINIATYKVGVDSSRWEHINGWSPSVLNYIQALERQQ